MKITIEGFNQAYATTLRKEVTLSNGAKKTIKIDCTDLVILRWFVDFYPKMKTIEVDGVKYVWLTHKKLLEDLPLIDITKRAFMERMQKLVEFNILEYKLLKENGTFSLYKFGTNYENLLVTGDTFEQHGDTFEQHRGIRSNDIGVYVQPTYKDRSIIDNSIKDNKEIDISKLSKDNLSISKESENLEEKIDLFWKAYPKKKDKGNVEKWFTKNQPTKELVEKMVKQIKRLKDTRQWKEENGKFIPYPTTWLNAKGWEDEFETDTEHDERVQKAIEEGTFYDIFGY